MARRRTARAEAMRDARGWNVTARFVVVLGQKKVLGLGAGVSLPVPPVEGPEGRAPAKKRAPECRDLVARPPDSLPPLAPYPDSADAQRTKK